VLLEPAAYSVSAPLTVPHANQVIFDLGEASVTASTNTPTIVVNDSATGTVLAGFQANGLGFDATTNTGPYAAEQIEIGNTPKATGQRFDPTSLSDVSTVSNSTTDELINQNYVLLNQAEIQSNNNSGSGYTTVNWPAESSSDYGIVVNGNNVTLEGIWLEHFKMTEATWNGNGGQVVFLENELPLTIPYSAAGVQPSFWKENSSFDGYPSLAVSPSVTSFTLTGMQSWSRFGSGCDCLVTSLITAPVKRHVSINDIFSGQILGSASLSGGPTAVGPGFPDFSGSTQGGLLNLINTDGVSSYIPYNPAMSGSFTATTSWASETVTNVSSFTGITVGSVIAAADITFDTTVTAINTTADTLTLSAAPTGSGSTGEPMTASGPGYDSFVGTTNGTTTVTVTPGAASSPEGLAVGSAVSAPDITAGQTVTGINSAAETLTLSAGFREQHVRSDHLKRPWLQPDPGLDRELVVSPLGPLWPWSNEPNRSLPKLESQPLPNLEPAPSRSEEADDLSLLKKQVVNELGRTARLGGAANGSSRKMGAKDERDRGRELGSGDRQVSVSFAHAVKVAVVTGKPSIGLEPMTPSLPWKCSTS
jgi:hypothetical protein